MALSKRSHITRWYAAQSTSVHDFAKEAYEDAIQYFEEHLTRDKDKCDWVRSQNSLQDVIKVVETARSTYEKHGDSKAHRSVCAFATRVQYYGDVLDILAQHHPEYVALAWGAIKFLFTGVLNHAELVTELSRALSNVSDVLPHIKLGMDLYPTTYMKEAVSRVYAYIMLFLQKAIKWYSMSPARRAWSALAKPYSIGYKDTVSQIRTCTESINLIASAAARAELRDQTILLGDQSEILKEHTAVLHRLDERLKESKDKTQHICDIADASQSKFDQIIHLSENTQKIARTISENVTAHGSRLQDIQFSQILDALKPIRMPDDVLHACKNVAQRRQLWRIPTQDSDRFIQILNLWINTQVSSLFVLRAGLRAEARAKDLALQATILLQRSQKTVFWYFSERSREDTNLTLSNVLKPIIFQILTRYPSVAQSDPQRLNVSQFKCQHTDQEWLNLLALLLRQVDTCFLVIEMEDLLERLRQSRQAIGDILQIFRDLVDMVQRGGSSVKILLVCSEFVELPDCDSDKNSATTFHMLVRQPVLPVKRSLAKKRAVHRATSLFG